jgi:hypothetical protein
LDQTATVVTTVDGGAAATIQQGGSVRISVRVGHSGFNIARMVGGSIITGHAGVGSNFHSSLPDEPTIVLGAFSGGSRIGGDIMFLPAVGTSPAWPNPLPIWEYDVSGLAPGVYAVGWQADPAFPNVRIYQSWSSFTFLEAQTTYVGATITVVPAGTPTAGIVGAFGLLAARRRRMAATDSVIRTSTDSRQV